MNTTTIESSGTDLALVFGTRPARTEQEISINGSILVEIGTDWTTLKPILVTVEQIDGSFVASLTDAGVHMSGDTPVDALEGLTSIIKDTFEFLTDHEEELGPGPHDQLSVLRSYIRPKNADEGPRQPDRP